MTRCCGRAGMADVGLVRPFTGWLVMAGARCGLALARPGRSVMADVAQAA
jgi:hypothetical protein